MAVAQPIEFWPVKDQREMSAPRRWGVRIVLGGTFLSGLGRRLEAGPAALAGAIFAFLIMHYVALWLLSSPVEDS